MISKNDFHLSKRIDYIVLINIGYIHFLKNFNNPIIIIDLANYKVYQINYRKKILY